MVAPYKPQEDCASVSDSPTSIKACSDRAPLLNGDKSENKKNGISLYYYYLCFYLVYLLLLFSRFNNVVG